MAKTGTPVRRDSVVCPYCGIFCDDLSLTLDGARVEVAAKGITDKDFALAKKFDEVIQWQPAKEGGPFEGTPSDPRFAYVRYDD